ncbi:hypothetical protein M378DRAFT_168006 [Amanita muscaria Koide BX008]|uniref:Uncharacterized protein n=1 Tax=Amanita muscaria (strain Koide BX008) TaxID=946122 RepID=A0A0C2WW18_AMAMK|nr:hypothetical protein M378DRAFT_168006 [Amanita muscaria Koide BX008]
MAAELKFDYVRVYQRKPGHDTNIWCDPKDYPTKKYIEDHIEAYTRSEQGDRDVGLPIPRLLTFTVAFSFACMSHS